MDVANSVAIALAHRRPVIHSLSKFNFNSWITKEMQSGFFIFVKVEMAELNE